MHSEAHELVHSIYDTVGDAVLWPAVLDRLSDSVGACGSLIFEIRADGGLDVTQHSSWYQRDPLEDYLATYRAEENRDQAMFLKHSIGHDAIDIIPDSILYDDIAEFRSRPNVGHVLGFGMLHRAACLLNKDNADVSRFSVQFRADRGPISAEETAVLNGLLPHVAKALELGRPTRRLAAENASLLAAMDRLSTGVALLDPDGILVVANEEMRRQIEAYPTILIQPDGALAMARPADQVAFRSLMEGAHRHGKFGARPRKEAIPVGHDTFLCIEVAPLDRVQDIGTARFGGFIVFSTDTSLPVACNLPALRRAFGLTEAECALVEGIADGLTNTQIAERRGRSVATINVQVKSILSKTGCATRTQFVRMMTGFTTRSATTERRWDDMV